MFRYANHFITLQQVIHEVQKDYPEFSRARLRGWIQRNGFPKAYIQESPGAGRIEGYYPKHIVPFIKEILKLQKEGLQLKDAFLKIDNQIIEALTALYMKNIDSPVFCHFASSIEVFRPFEVSIFEGLAEFRDTEFYDAETVDGAVSKKQLEAINTTLNDIRENLEAYMVRYNAVKSIKSTDPSPLFSEFKRTFELYGFCKEWGYSRKNNQIIKCVEQESAVDLSPIDCYLHYLDHEERW